MTRTIRPFLTALTLAAAFTASPALACPNCKDAIPASAADGDDDPFAEAKAYNRSIYLMVSMPYLLVGTVGFFVYRSFRAQKK